MRTKIANPPKSVSPNFWYTLWSASEHWRTPPARSTGRGRGMDQASLELLSAQIETIGRLIERADQADVYDELMDRIEELVLDLIRTRLN